MGGQQDTRLIGIRHREDRNIPLLFLIFVKPVYANVHKSPAYFRSYTDLGCNRLEYRVNNGG
jgi:hypothetical protein